MAQKISYELLKKFCASEADITDCNYMLNPFIVDDTIYACKPTMCLRFPANLYNDSEEIKDIVDIFDNDVEQSSRKIEHLKNYVYGFESDYKSVNVNVKKLQKLIDSIPLEDETEWVGDERECPECYGEGEVEWEYVDRDGHTHNEMHDCPVCDGTGIIGHRYEMKTGRKIIPYYSNISFGFPYNIRVLLLNTIIELLNQLHIEEFELQNNKYKNGAKFRIVLDNGVELIVMGTFVGPTEDLEYAYNVIDL